MDYARIPFAGGRCERVISPKIRQVYCDHLNQLYGARPHAQQMPAPNPVSLMRKDLGRLEQHAYGVSAKTDGTRYVLLALQGQVLMIDRAYNMHVVPLQLEAPAYEGLGSVLDGELVQCSDGTWRYLVFDCAALGGRSLMDLHLYTDRLDAAKHFCEQFLRAKVHDPFQIEPKRFFALRNLDRLWKTLPQLDHHCDGLVFTPLTERIRTGRQFSMLKWKFANEHTIDARVEWERCEGGERYRLQTIDGKQFIDWSILEEPFAQECRALGLGPHSTGTIVECRYLPEAQSWRVERVRHDKAVPNTRLTSELTLQNIQENITLEELYLVAEHCMTKYNERQNKGPGAGRLRPKDKRQPTTPPVELSPEACQEQPPDWMTFSPRSPPYSAPSPPRSPPKHAQDYAPPNFVHPARAQRMQSKPGKLSKPTRKRVKAAKPAPIEAAPEPVPAQEPLPQAGTVMSTLNSLLQGGLLDALAATQK